VFRSHNRSAHADSRVTHWRPPAGWIETAAGIYVPPDYTPGPYELPAPDISTRAAQVREWNRCRARKAYFAFHFCWTVDVDSPGDDTPMWRRFPAYPHLREFFDAVEEPSNTHTDKSRQMSLSWAWMIAFLHDLIFKEEWPMLVISRRAKEVDDGGENSTKDSLLGKLRLVWTRLPHFLAPSLDIKRYLVSNPSQNNHVKGETGNMDAGRGSTYKRALMDEAAHTKHGETVFAAVRSAAKSGTNLNGTPNGKDNVFYRIRHDKHTTFKKLRFHWTQHPRYAAGLYCVCRTWKAKPGTGVPAIVQFQQHARECPRLELSPPQPAQPRSPFYDKVLRDHTPEQVAREYDISYEGSKAGRIMDTFDSLRHVFNHTAIAAVGEMRAEETPWEYRERYLRAVLDPALPLVIGWDFGAADHCVMTIGQEIDPARAFIRWVDAYYHKGQRYDHYRSVWNTFYLPLWRSLVPGFDPEHYGDPAGSQRDSKLESWISNLAEDKGDPNDPPIVIQYDDDTDRSVLEWIDLLKTLQARGDYQVSSYAAFLIDANEQYSWPVDREGNRIPGRHRPVHNIWSHPMDSHRYVYMFRYGNALLHHRDPGDDTSPADDALTAGLIGTHGDFHAGF
jgi:hypothetical protein